MRLMLGIDTGGSFTDAGLVDGTGRLVAKAKTATTHKTLAIGIGKAVAEILSQITAKQKSAIRRVVLSTTLATNAVVEGTGQRVGLLLIGFQPSILGKITLPPATPHAFIRGGHTSAGNQQHPLDTQAIAKFIAHTNAGKNKVAGYAIAGYFATRNPDHELQAAEIIKQHTDLPISLSHTLSSDLGGDRRAVTALLNARLMAGFAQQITACQQILADADIDAELMLMKGDGGVVAAVGAGLYPIETILSGAAASMAGATHLARVAEGTGESGKADALVCDIGGTTTDIGVMRGGVPRLTQKARVGDWGVQIAAVDCHTYGIGGDSEVRLLQHEDDTARQHADQCLVIGPRRVIPLSRLAHAQPELQHALHTTLARQLANPIASPSDGRFIVPLFQGDPPGWLSRSEYALAKTCSDYYGTHRLVPIGEVAATRLALAAIPRLLAHGLIRLASFTPTDAVHVLGEWRGFDSEAAIKGGALLARQKTAAKIAKRGVVAESAEAIAKQTIDQWVVQSALALYDSACVFDRRPHARAGNNPVVADIVRAGLVQSKNDLVGGAISLTQPVIALGGAAGYYRQVARLLNTRLIIPPHAEVAAAIGAAVSCIREYAKVTITQPDKNIFRVHGTGSPCDFSAFAAAAKQGEATARRLATAKAKSAGARSVSVTVACKKNMVRLGGQRELFIEAVIEATATGA